MDSFTENVIEFVKGEHTATVTFSQNRFISKIKALAEKFPNDVKIEHENSDGSIIAHLPVTFIKIGKKECNLTEEQKQASRERLKKYHASKNGSVENDELNADD